MRAGPASAGCGGEEGEKMAVQEVRGAMATRPATRHAGGKHAQRLALAGLLLASSAQAQQAWLNVNGTINLALEEYAATDSSGRKVHQQRLNSWGSRVGIKGGESFDRDLQLLFQVEGNMKADEGSGGISNRQSWIALSGPAGMLKLGRFLHIYDDVSVPWYFIQSAGSHNPVALWANCGGRTAVKDGCFDDYLPNSVRYNSPELAGWKLSVSHARPNESNGRETGRIMAAGAEYRQAAAYVGFAYQQHDSVRAAGLKDHAMTISGAYTWGALYMAMGM